MSESTQPASPAARRHRLLALGCAALVFALTIFAASPVVHDLLHAGKQAPAEDACAVVLFAGGVSLPVGSVALTAPVLLAHRVAPQAAEDALLVSPRYLRQPERGPPAV